MSAKRFSFSRLFYQGRIELAERWKFYFLSGWIVAGIYLAISLVYLLFGKTLEASSAVFFFRVNLFVGVLLASSVFSEIGNPERARAYLLIPSSRLEKFLAKFLLTTVGYFLCSMVIMFAASCLTGLLNWLVAKDVMFVFDPRLRVWISANPLAGEGGYYKSIFFLVLDRFIFLHAIFFFGAVFFKRYHLPKILGSLVLINIFFLFLLIIGTFAFGLSVHQGLAEKWMAYLQDNGTAVKEVFSSGWRLFLFLLPIVLYGLAYWIFSRKQVKS